MWLFWLVAGVAVAGVCGGWWLGPVVCVCVCGCVCVCLVWLVRLVWLAWLVWLV